MRDLIEDIRTNLTTVQTEIYKEIEFIEKDVKHYKEQYAVHDDLMTKLKDDSKIYENSCNLLRENIKDFELLVQDVSSYNRSEHNRHQLSMQDKIGNLLSEIDLIKDG